MSLGSNGMDRVRSFRKISMRLRTTNFCTSSARFAPSFVSQPNGPKCNKIVRNSPKHEFWVQWGWNGCVRCENFCSDFLAQNLHQFGPFCTEFRNSTKRSQCPKIIWNAPKHQFRSNRIYRVRSFRKITMRLRATNFCTSSARFAPSFRKSTKRSPMHQNCTKCTKTWV